MDPDPEVSLLFATGKSPLHQSDVTVKFSTYLYNRKPLPQDFEEQVEEIWQKRCEQNPKIWNGTKFRLDSYSINKEK